MKQFLSILYGILIGFAAAGLVLLMLRPPRGEPVTLYPPPTARPLSVHICGAVTSAGVYSLPVDALVADALQAAGGASSLADLDSINLAARVADGQKLFIPYLQPTSISGETQEKQPAGDGLVNLNLAEAPELERLPGIGPATAKKIVEYRQAHGPFLAVEDLLQVSGIGETKLEQLRDLVTVY